MAASTAVTTASLATNSRLDSIPEPSTYALFGLGLLGILVLHHHRRKARAERFGNNDCQNIPETHRSQEKEVPSDAVLDVILRITSSCVG